MAIIDYPRGAGGVCTQVRTLEDYAKHPDRDSDRYAREVRALIRQLIDRQQQADVELVLHGLLRQVRRGLSSSDNADLIAVALDVLDVVRGTATPELNWRGRPGIRPPHEGDELVTRGVILSNQCVCSRNIPRPCWATTHVGTWSESES